MIVAGAAADPGVSWKALKGAAPWLCDILAGLRTK
jgi:hypothetical protein